MPTSIDEIVLSANIEGSPITYGILILDILEDIKYSVVRSHIISV